MKKKTDKNKLGRAVVRQPSIQLRKQLMKRLKGLDANILVSVVRQGERGVKSFPVDFYSDWPDTYNRDSWYKTWAKAELADIAPTLQAIVKRKKK